jgi:hypothetical protein
LNRGAAHIRSIVAKGVVKATAVLLQEGMDIVEGQKGSLRLEVANELAVFLLKQRGLL